MNADAPLASSLALAGGDELTVYELMGLRLDAGLVVLSVCDTARGETTGGDDVLGLTRGLLGAGAATVLMSVAVGFAVVVLIGIATFALQARLPYKKMLIVTGAMIGAVLLAMVGNTVNVLQVIGWMSITPLRFLNPPKRRW